MGRSARREVGVLTAAIVGCVAMAGPAAAGETPSTPGAAVYFANLEDGAEVTSPLTIVFGLRGMGVAPAGVAKDGTGHHHLIVDRSAYGTDAEDDLDFGIPADENHKHFGGGQTETTMELSPGQHTLQLVLGDQDHIPHNPPVMSDVITITVK